MKMNKKKLAVVSLVLCIAAIISMGSLAWFTAEDSIVNNLSFVNDFAMDLVETDATGAVVGTEGSTTGLTFTNLVPNQTIHKDPTVINKSATEPQWVKMTVKVSNGAAWATVLGPGTKLWDIFTGYTDSLWVHPSDPVLDDSDNIVATFYLKDKLIPGGQIPLFTGIKISNAIETTDVSSLNGTTITIEAKAIQSSELGVSTCVDAFNLVG